MAQIRSEVKVVGSKNYMELKAKKIYWSINKTVITNKSTDYGG